MAPVIVSLAVASLLLLVACARSISDDLGSDGPALFSSDAGEAATGNRCISTVCPAPYATCPGDYGLCTTNLKNDVEHCGACNEICPKRASGATFVCSGGECKLVCAPLQADCNHSTVDGCEVSTGDDPKNCGACGNTCKEGDLCWRGACGCPKGFTACGTECVQLDSDQFNCGMCGNVCHAPTDPADPAWRCGPNITPNNTKWTCESAACALDCLPGFGDCNKQFCADGCELNLLTDTNNCGACGHKCDSGQACVFGSCLCPAGLTNCDGECVDLQSDPANCRVCGGRCPGPSSASARQASQGGPTCVAGECGYVCFPGFADCDEDYSNGCEVNIQTDPRHCGGCKSPCPLGPEQPCVAGQCLSRDCDAGVAR